MKKVRIENLETLREIQSDTKYVIDKGDYEIGVSQTHERFLYLSNNDGSVKRIAFLLENLKNVVMDFSGSTLTFQGRITPFIIRDCVNVTLKNFTVAYDRPFFTCGKTLEHGGDYAKIRIDSKKFPYRIENGAMIAYGKYWEKYVAFDRNTTSNVCKWRFDKAGEYSVTTFEPYTCRYACIVYDEGLDVEFAIRDYENPNAERLQFSCADKRVEKIMEAARATLAQNAVDLLTDCPSRERAGWLSDSYFSSVAERIFTGENQVEKAFLDNYAKAYEEQLPKGMIPMCYPADYIGDAYIPNWALWYIMEMDKYAKIYGVDDAVLGAKDTVLGILEFFTRYENELGLLENLESWVFVEWSSANDADHVCGVNIPSNMEYAACLKVAGRLYGIPEFLEKAAKIDAEIKARAYDGKFFVDNLIRNEKGELVQSGLLTEVCQYYAFWFGCADKREYADLYAELMQNLGTSRAEGYMPNVGVPNVMYGLYMRIDLLMRDNERQKVFDECIRLFEPMANRTGTLWEHNGISASCNHGFASYAAKWLIYALTGYDAINGGSAAKEGIGIDCEIALPLDGKGNYRYLSVKNNRVSVK